MENIGYCVVNAPDGEGGLRAGGLGHEEDDPALTLEAASKLLSSLLKDEVIPWQLKRLNGVLFVANTHPDLEHFSQ